MRVLLSMLLLLPVISEKHPEKATWIVEKSSTLRIEGSTSVNKFCCRVDEYSGPDTLAALSQGGEVNPECVTLKGALSIDIEDFNCTNRAMTNEFKKTLKYRQYPQLRIVFVSLAKMPSPGVGTEPVKGAVDVELAGISKRFEIGYAVCKTGEDNIDLLGSRTFGFSEFGLVPPRKIGGLVKVNDQLNVQFKLHLRAIH